MRGEASIISKRGFVPGAVIVLAMTTVAYLRVFGSEFISWDDAELLLNNKDVHQFRIKNFFTTYYTGNYHPLTMLLYAIDWKLFGAAAWGHHLISLLLHGINAILVFSVTLKLFKNLWGALFCATVFCLHPVQVESVAWVAETKTTLFSLFFLLGINFYMDFLFTNNKKKLYIHVLLCFILALLSKPAAVGLPLCLIALDFITGRNLSKRILIEKIPFILLSVLFGILTLYTQQQDNYLNESHAYPLYERGGYAGYALLMYCIKFLFPFKLAVIYPYPGNKIAALIIGYLFVLCLLFIGYLLLRRKKYPLFGFLFFIISSLFLVLQLIPFGEVLTADRYMYLAVIGFSWTLLGFIRTYEMVLKGALFFVVIFFGIATFARTKVWQNSIELYSDILKNYPDSPMALNSLGAEYMLRNEDEKAYAYLNKAIQLNPGHYKFYYNRGVLLSKNGKYIPAIKDLGKSIELRNYPKAYAARANVYYSLKDCSRAIADAEMAIKLEPANIRANYVLANCYEDMDLLEKSLYFYNKTLELNPGEPLFYLRRAIVYGKQRLFKEGLADLDKATELNPKYAEAYYWKGVSKVNLKQNPCSDFQTAVKLGFEAAQGPITKYCN